MIVMSENGESRGRRGGIRRRMTQDHRTLFNALCGARPPLRRRVLRRRHLDRHLLPAHLPGQDAEGSRTAGSSTRRRKRSRPASAPACAAAPSSPRATRRSTTPSASRSSIVQRLEEGQLDDDAGLEAIADQFELSSRQIRRIVQKELGVPPIQLLLTRRLLLAKQLLTETTLPITEIAFASGFSSLRRFNDAFTQRYGMPPTRLRRKASDGRRGDRRRAAPRRCSSPYRPPYDWDGILAFLRRARADRRRARRRATRTRGPCSSARPRAGSACTRRRSKHALHGRVHAHA